jgi:hypothetical protein
MGVWFEDKVSVEFRDTELRIRPSTMDLLVKVYAQWREQSGYSGEAPKELPEKTD